jgi:hypothetical protein
MLNAQTQISKEVTYFVDKNGNSIIPVKHINHKIIMLQDALQIEEGEKLTFAELEYRMDWIELERESCSVRYNAANNTVEIISNPNSSFECVAACFNLMVLPEERVLPSTDEVKAMSPEAQAKLISTMFYELQRVRYNNLLAENARCISSPATPSDRDAFALEYGFDISNKIVSDAYFYLRYKYTPKTKASSIKLPF